MLLKGAGWDREAGGGGRRRWRVGGRAAVGLKVGRCRERGKRMWDCEEPALRRAEWGST